MVYGDILNGNVLHLGRFASHETFGADNWVKVNHKLLPSNPSVHVLYDDEEIR